MTPFISSTPAYEDSARPTKAAVQDALKNLRKEIDGGITKAARELHDAAVP